MVFKLDSDWVELWLILRTEVEIQNHRDSIRSFQYYSYFRVERCGGVYDTARGGWAILLFGMWQEHG